MRNVYTIENHADIHNKITFSVNEKAQDIQMIPAGKVIVDSDDHAFIYIVEEGGVFSYLHFGEATWPALVEMLVRGEDPYLFAEGEPIELHQFHEELEALIYNIEGNSNYGDEFVARVETAFRAVLANDEV